MNTAAAAAAITTSNVLTCCGIQVPYQFGESCFLSTGAAASRLQRFTSQSSLFKIKSEQYLLFR